MTAFAVPVEDGPPVVYPAAGASDLKIVPVVFAPLGTAGPAVESGVQVVDARTVLGVLR